MPDAGVVEIQRPGPGNREPRVRCAHDEIVPLEKLTPNPRNPNRHPARQIELLARIIAAQGWRAPISVSLRSGFVVRGHARLEAARLLGCDRAPVDFQEYATEAEEWADLIADNRIAELAETDEDLLRELLQSIQLQEFDAHLAGFDDDDELMSLLSALEPTEGLTDPDDVPALPEDPVTRPGDLWRLGPHRLLCGDGTVPGVLEMLLKGARAHMVFTDPPYNVDYTGKSRKPGRTGMKIRNDSLGDGFARFLLDACRRMLSVCAGPHYICMSSSELPALQRAFLEAGGHWSTFIIWAKNHFSIGRSDYHRQYEAILYGWREGDAHFWCGARDQGDVWFFDKPLRNDLHPTMKPVDLVERAIENSSRSGEIVLDPFAGSGSTVIACERSGRVARLVELDPVYCDVIVRRWQDFTGRDAYREKDERRFNDLAGPGDSPA